MAIMQSKTQAKSVNIEKKGILEQQGDLEKRNDKAESEWTL